MPEAGQNYSSNLADAPEKRTFCLLKYPPTCSIIRKRTAGALLHIVQPEGGDLVRDKNILQVLKDSRYTVVLSGVEMLKESGYPLLRDGEESYEIEGEVRVFF